ncbi:6-pyruvoyl tetrahydrobiopterin synthase [Salmonella enterica]|nr:6-pyruvoyl tetrahydrobiopterin synthase [Salmonella enterica]
MPFRHVRQAVSGFKGEIFIQRGGHDELSGNKKTAVGYRKAHFLSLTKTIIRLVTGN